MVIWRPSYSVPTCTVHLSGNPRWPHCRRRKGTSGFEDGTAHFLAIAALRHGFAAIARAGGMPAIRHHTAAITRFDALTILASV